MPSKQVTLLVRLTNFDAIINTVVDVDKALLPIVANMDKVVLFFVADLPQEVQQPFVQQFTVFLEHICEAGDEANLMREYLGNCFSEGDESAALLVKALSALTQKDLLILESLEDVAKWVTVVVSALNEPYITKLVIATILSSGEKPDDDKELRKLYLSLR